MAPRHYAFQFDDKRFARHIAPWALELSQGKFERLRIVAYEMAVKDSETTRLLDNLHISHVYDYYLHPEDDEDPPRLQESLVVFMKPFMASLPPGTQLGANGWLGYRRLLNDLEVVGWTPADTRLILRGNSACQALELHGLARDLIYSRASLDDAVPWCDTGLGWIGNQQIVQLHEKAHRAHDTLASMLDQGEATGRSTVGLGPIEAEAFMGVFTHLQLVLSAAKTSGQALLVTIAS